MTGKIFRKKEKNDKKPAHLEEQALRGIPIGGKKGCVPRGKGTGEKRGTATP